MPDRKHNEPFLEGLLQPCIRYKTTTKADFVSHKNVKPVERSPKTQQTDESLIAGHYVNNLKLKDLDLKTKTWPRSMDWREDYKQFLKRTKWCNEDTFKLFFECPKVRYDLVEKFMEDFQKTIYSLDYSPKDYKSLYSQRQRVGVVSYDYASGLSNTDYQTTYGNYYNRLQEVPYFTNFLFKKKSYSEQQTEINMEAFDKAMRKLFRKYNLTTYYDEICVPALVGAKDGIMPTGPIDRYTLRKL